MDGHAPQGTSSLLSVLSFTVQREECSQPFATKQVSRASNTVPRDGDEVTVCDAQLEFLGEFGHITKDAVFKGRNASFASIALSAWQISGCTYFELGTVKL